ncbi:glycerophosphodiester phosphodiesterase family protein [Sporosarcina saromensis]|uniref:Glycerophosphodiester phosphodiesterase family protein n=1 Tax=Sporosarcina saromensis TaxID=359365 RepID=A0ABU4G8C0_9BACL|nr:glycerophosphodiester phosphodiesterase family protein [Sporosarcina saromensis]MDW0112570.1 glycerophosphodiester phosphodiesterase family protein [Sporosarcina saromensis]
MKKIASVLIGTVLMSGCSMSSTWDNPIPKDEFLVVAHRGASTYEPENTLPAFKLAENLDADYIELDIQLTKDGELVVMHDKDVKRTTESEGKIQQATVAELKQLTADEKKGGEKADHTLPEEAYKVPTLKEVIEAVGERVHFIIELKNTKEYIGIEAKLVEFMEEHALIGPDQNGMPKVIVHSFNKRALKQIHKLAPNIPLLQLISFDEGEEAEVDEKEVQDIQTYAKGIGVTYEALTPAFVNTMHGKNLAVFAYTVNDETAALRLQAMGVNGIHTDQPDLLKEEG